MKSEISHVLELLSGTEESEILTRMEETYDRIHRAQQAWYNETNWTCVEDCGKCCEHFEPDLFEGEALYMAAWLIENDPERAMHIANEGLPNDSDRCSFYNPDSVYHCKAYGGRALICRLFGAGCTKTKEGKPCWRPCKFMSSELLALHNPPLEHRQYEGDEIREMLGAIPPIMSDMADQVPQYTPGNDTAIIIREALPRAIQKLLWIIELKRGSC